MAQRPDPPAVIIGGGLTGISAALHLKRSYVLCERETRLGGLARTEERDGFFFDQTGHWLHLRDDDAKEMVARHLGDDLVSIQRRARVYTEGALLRHPFQANVHGLPKQAAYECLLGYVQSLLRRGGDEPRNFEQYIVHHFGEGIARHFMVPYNSKLWGVHPREITSAWCRRFVPIPSLEEMLAGAVGAPAAELGYNVRFHYPRQGGIETLVRGLVSSLDPRCLRLGCNVEAIDPGRRIVHAAGEELPYHALISTMPLPELIHQIVDPPREVVVAADELRATPVRYLNLATRSRPPESFHWLYVPEERLPFYRVGVFSAAVPTMAPPGCSSYYVELASRAPVNQRAALVAEAVRALVEVHAVSSAEDVVFAELREIPCAYVIFDERYERALDRIFPYLEKNRIYSRGRYGSWIYNSMEDSLLAGKEVAALIDGLATTATAREEG
jgi:protoporphyrinogen oxidase